jgi:tetratricopeptide (TPR) repeat protein
MKRILLALTVSVVMLLSSATASFAQQFTSKEVKTYEKAWGYYDKGDYEKAIKKLQPLLDAHNQNDKLWSSMVEFYLKRYNAEKKREMQELMDQLMKSLASKKKNTTINITPGKSKQYWGDFIEICSRATLKAENQEDASIYLRLSIVDHPVDTAVKKEAKEKFKEAEEEFGKKNYAAAIDLYREALKIDSSYYKAILYIGDCMWNNNQSESALGYYFTAIRMQPNLLEPRKYLVDAYISMKHYEKAYEECINAITVHPDVGMFLKMDKIAKNLNKDFDRHWMSRRYSINQPDFDQGAISEEPWKYYREAKAMISSYCDENGVIIKSNSLTKQKYMETYCWEYMLKKSNDPSLEFARKAMLENYLDCYVFVSMYHVTLDSQYQHFSKENKDKIRNYINKYLVL